MVTSASQSNPLFFWMKYGFDMPKKFQKLELQEDKKLIRKIITIALWVFQHAN